jgi:hypothetical protein
MKAKEGVVDDDGRSMGDKCHIASGRENHDQRTHEMWCAMGKKDILNNYNNTQSRQRRGGEQCAKRKRKTNIPASQIAKKRKERKRLECVR